MATPPIPRREFLQQVSAGTAGVMLAAGALAGAPGKPGPRLHLATNQYPWMTFYRRDGRDYAASLSTVLKEVAAAGLDGFEPIIERPEQVDELAPLLKQHGLAMRSLYVNSTLHTAEAEKSIAGVLAVAEKARRLAGTRILVTNPSPIRWGGKDDKTDAQLKAQAAALNQLGGKLAELGMVLSYHYHDAELRQAAREFHHMLVGTDPKLVTLCLDAHWVYRGAGNSALAVFDLLKLYGSRVTELHLRQSREHVWTESFGEGDLDYPAVAQHLSGLGVKPHVVLEQAVEDKTPKAASAEEAHRRGAEYARRVFGGMAG